MLKCYFKLSSIFIFVALLAVGCASVNYVGKSFDSTTKVDMYFAKEEIKKEYTVIGHALGSGTWVSNDKIQRKLIEEAKFRGANAILITGLGKLHIPIGDDGGSVDEKQIKASFIKYK